MLVYTACVTFHPSYVGIFDRPTDTDRPTDQPINNKPTDQHTNQPTNQQTNVRVHWEVSQFSQTVQKKKLFIDWGQRKEKRGASFWSSNFPMNPRADWLIGLPVSPIGALVHIHMLPIFSWLCENLAGPNARHVTRTCKISCLVMRVQAHGICGMFSFYCVFKSTRLKLQINFVF